MSYVAQKSMILPFTDGTNALIKRRAKGVEVEFGDGYQGDLVDQHGWSDEQADQVDEQLLARLPKGSSVHWEDRELFHINLPKGASQDPVLDVAALLKHVRDNPVDADLLDRVQNPDRPRGLPIPAQFRERLPAEAYLLPDPHGGYSLNAIVGRGQQRIDPTVATELFRHLDAHPLAAEEPASLPATSFVFGQASQQAAAGAAAAVAGPLAGISVKLS